MKKQFKKGIVGVLVAVMLVGALPVVGGLKEIQAMGGEECVASGTTEPQMHNFDPEKKTCSCGSTHAPISM